MFLKNLQNLQENTCVGVFIKSEIRHKCFPVILCDTKDIFKKSYFYEIPPVAGYEYITSFLHIFWIYRLVSTYFMNISPLFYIFSEYIASFLHILWIYHLVSTYFMNISPRFYIFSEETILRRLRSLSFSEKFLPVSLIWRWCVFDRHIHFNRTEESVKLSVAITITKKYL